MIMVLINWLYIGITSFLTGFAVLSLFTRLFPYKVKYLVSYMFAGLAVVTVYAQLYSLFAGVSIMANVILIVLCIFIAIYKRKEISVCLEEKIKKTGKKKGLTVTYILLFILFLYGTSRGYMHFDTGLYHAQSIRWIEEYGVVPGLANLQARFAYNSAAFPLTALYSMKFLFGQSLHTTAGFFAFLSACLTVDIYRVFTERKVEVSDYIRLGLVFYLSIIYSQMVSPASDYYAQLLIFDCVILWLDTHEGCKERNEKESAEPYALLCILMVFAVTIKFSVGLMLLLVILPAVMLLKEKKGREIAVSILSGITILLPFLIRNVVISGWLVYPSTIMNFFSVDWKVPKGQVQYDAMEIGVYGKGINDVTKWDTPFSQWIRPWFDGLKGLEKVFVLATVLCLVTGIIYLLVTWLHYCKKRTNKPDICFTLIFSVISISTVFWFVQAPLIRYGYAYILLMPCLLCGYLYALLQNKFKSNPRLIKWWVYVFGLFTVLFLLYRAKGFVADIVRTCKQEYYFAQLDYADGDATTYEVNGITIYVPTSQGQIGYYKFPSSPLVQDIELRGKTIEDGFRQRTSE